MTRTVSGRFVVVMILALTAVMVGIAAFMLFGHPRGKIAPPPSIAVLPVIGDPTGAVTAEIMDALKPLPNVEIADAALYAKKRQDTRAIGEKLNVRTVLDCSLDGTRVTVKLINAADAFDLWSHTYEHGPAFKDSLAHDIAAELSLK